MNSISNRILAAWALLVVLLGGTSLAGPPDQLPKALFFGEVRTLEITHQNHLHYRFYRPESPRGVVVYLHGIQSHSEWYGQSCHWLAERGYVVYALDRRGSGLNVFDRGHLESYEDLVADLDSFISQIRRDFPDLPVFVLGVSWGGKLALYYGSIRDEQIEGIVLSTPGIKSKVDLSIWRKLQVFWTFRKPQAKQPRIPIPIDRTSLFTADGEWQRWIESDHETLREATSRFYWESNKLDRKLKRTLKTCTQPILLQLAEDDEIIDNQKTLEFIAKRTKRPVTPGPVSEAVALEVLVYPQARHTLEFEPYAWRATQHVADWLDKFNRFR